VPVPKLILFGEASLTRALTQVQARLRLLQGRRWFADIRTECRAGAKFTAPL
jgi:hypothetical protein